MFSSNWMAAEIGKKPTLTTAVSFLLSTLVAPRISSIKII